MKHIQILFGMTVIFCIFANPVLALNHAANTDSVEEMIQAIIAALQDMSEESRGQEEKVKQLEREIKTLEAQLEICQTSGELSSQKAERIGLLEAIKLKTQTAKSLAEAIKKSREEAERKVVVVKRMETLVTQMIEIVEQNREMEKSFVTLTAISKDRSKVLKLLESAQNNNRVEATQLIAGALISAPVSGIAFSWTGVGALVGGESTASATASVSEIQNTNGVKIVFQIGKLRHCLSTKSQCSGKQYSVSK